MTSTTLAELRLFDTDVSSINGTIPELISLPSEGAYTLGRSVKCDIVLSAQKNDGKFIISRQHASLVLSRHNAKQPSLTIEDLQSLNGVYVNGVRVQKHSLCEGDVVQFGGMSDIPIGGTLTSSDVSLKYTAHFPSSQPQATRLAHTTPASEKSAAPPASAAKSLSLLSPALSANSKRGSATHAHNAHTTPAALPLPAASPLSLAKRGRESLGAQRESHADYDNDDDALPADYRSLNVVKRAKTTRTPQQPPQAPQSDNITPNTMPSRVVDELLAEMASERERQKKENDDLRRKMESLHELVVKALLRRETESERESEKKRETHTDRERETEREKEREKEREGDRAERERLTNELAIERKERERLQNEIKREKEKEKERERESAAVQHTVAPHKPAAPPTLSQTHNTLTSHNAVSHCVVSEATLKAQLSCVLCASLYVNAVVLRCSHSFCRLCVTQHWQRRVSLCPLCCDPFPSTMSERDRETLCFPSTQLDELVFLMVEASSAEEKQAYEAREVAARNALRALKVDVDKGYAHADGATNVSLREKESSSTPAGKTSRARDDAEREREQCAFCGKRGHTEDECSSKGDGAQRSDEEEDFS